MVDYPMLGFICLAAIIYGLLFREIRRFRREVRVSQQQDAEIINILDRAQLIRAMRSDIANDKTLGNQTEWDCEGAFLLDEPEPNEAA